MPTTLTPAARTTARTKRNYLSEISTEIRQRPTAAVIYGPPGIGKTSLGAASTKPLFLIDSKEDGINTLKQANQCDENIPVLPAFTNFPDVLDCLDQLAADHGDAQTLVIDTLDGMEGLCHAHVCKTEFGGHWGIKDKRRQKGFAAFSKGYEVAVSEWLKLLDALDGVRDAGMSVICLAHSVNRLFRSPETEDFEHWTPDLHAKTWARTHRWADMVLFCNHVFDTVSDQGTRAKGRGRGLRRIYTEWRPAFEAKNRMSLPSHISMGDSGATGWKNVMAAVVKSRSRNGN